MAAADLINLTRAEIALNSGSGTTFTTASGKPICAAPKS